MEDKKLETYDLTKEDSSKCKIDNNHMYGDEFYEHESETAKSSAHHLITSLLEELNHMPNSVVDIGCGLGDFLKEFLALGVTNILGVDGNHVPLNKLKIPIENFIAHDLRKPLKLNQKYDLALCLEVAEHIEEEYADLLVKSITETSPLVLFSAAIPGQGGTHHVNEKWPQYWQDKFLKHDYVMLDFLRAKIWNSKDISWWYKQNVVILCRSDKVDELLRLKASRAVLPAISPDFIDYKIDELLKEKDELLERCIQELQDTSNKLRHQVLLTRIIKEEANLIRGQLDHALRSVGEYEVVLSQIPWRVVRIWRRIRPLIPGPVLSIMLSVGRWVHRRVR